LHSSISFPTERAASIGQFTAFVLGFIGLFNPILVFVAVFVHLAAASKAHSSRFARRLAGRTGEPSDDGHFGTLQPDTHIDKAVNALLQTSQGTFPVVTATEASSASSIVPTSFSL
jgi:stage IV sporulation protein FB